MSRTVSCLLALAALAAGPAGAAASEPTREAALGLSGEIYLARRGACWQLFGNCTPAAENRPVLAVDILQTGQEPRRLLVPETDGPEVEGTPALIFEDASASLFIVWESKRQPTQSRVNLVWLTGGQWSPVIEVTGDVSPLKGPPQVVITRDEFRLTGTAEAVARHLRTVLHAVWWEEAPALGEVYYTPIILDNGVYLGHNRVYNLSALDPNPAPAQPQVLPAHLVRSPRVSVGHDERSVVIGFVNPRSQRFLVFESQVVAGELSDAAEAVEAEFEASAETYAGDVPALADRIRSHFVEFGVRLHPGLLTYMADHLRASIVSFAEEYPDDLPYLADRIRSHFVEFGARELASGGLAGGDTPRVARLLETAPGTTVGVGIHHAFWLRLVSDRPAPAVGAGPIGIFLSEDGLAAVVSWEQQGAVLYRETRDAAWSPALRIELVGAVDAARVEQILRQRVRER